MSTERTQAQGAASSLAFAVQHFADSLVSGITAGDIESYKTFRIAEHGVRDITLRHDLHVRKKVEMGKG